MPSLYPTHVIYKLKHESAQAAKELVALEEELRQDHPFAQPGRIASSPRGANIVRRDITDEIDRQKPGLVDRLGLRSGAIHIRQSEDTYPRAYKHYPYIVRNEGKKPADYFMVCPVDYKGSHHVPEDADKMPDKDFYSESGELIHKKNGILSPPLLIRNEEGTALPCNFNFLNGANAEYSHKVFIAAGSSLSCVQDFLNRVDALDNAKEEVRQEVERIAPLIDGSKLLGAREGDKLTAECTIDHDESGKAQVWVRLEHAGRETDKAVMLKDNEYFTLDDYRRGAFRISPNTQTEPGRALDRVFSKLGNKPDLGQYWQLWNPTAPQNLTNAFNRPDAKVPQLDTVRGVHYLVYLIDNTAEKDHCHAPGSIPVNAAEYFWLKEDLKDEEMGITPPEPPQALQHLRPVKRHLAL